MYLKSNKIEIMINDKADKVIEELFQSLLSRYQIRLETSNKGNKFVFNGINLQIQNEVTVTVTLNLEKVAGHSEKITKI